MPVGPMPAARRTARLLGVALLVVAGAAACGDDGDDAAGSSTTASTTTTVGGESSITLRVAGEERSLTVQTCRSDSETAIDLTANDDEGNTLVVQSSGGSNADGNVSITYRGASEDREGTARSVDIRADGTFDLSGILSVADDSAPGPDEFTMTGNCAG